MANIKISELNELSTGADNDYLPIVDSSESETKKISLENLKEYNNEGIIESGINNNGNWVKYEDGTMICYHTFSRTFTEDTWGSMYEYGTTDIDFPGNFISQPTVTATVAQGGGGGEGIIARAAARTNGTGLSEVYLVRPTQYTSRMFYISYIAIGKWK